MGKATQLLGMKEGGRGGKTTPFAFWWALLDLNQRPTDYEAFILVFLDLHRRSMFH